MTKNTMFKLHIVVSANIVSALFLIKIEQLTCEHSVNCWKLWLTSCLVQELSWAKRFDCMLCYQI